MTDPDDITGPAVEDGRPAEVLVAAYLHDPESERGQHALRVLHIRGGEEAFREAERPARSATSAERAAGATILAQLGCERREYLEESVTILLALLRDPSDDVVAAAATALGHRRDARAIEPLLELVGHPSEDVRFGVAFGLLRHDDSRALAALARLSGDTDRDVRSWATFGLAQQAADSPAIREVLMDRTTDEDAEVRGEALIGLSVRRDERALPLVRVELSGEFNGDWAVGAAEHLADPSLYPILESVLRGLDPDDRTRFGSSFDGALEACRPRASGPAGS